MNFKYVKVSLLSLMSASALSSWADGTLIINDLNLKPGEEKVVEVFLTNDEDIATFECKIDIPQGLEVVSMPEPNTERVPIKKGTWLSEWKNVSETTLYFTYLSNDPTKPGTWIQGSEGAVASFVVRAKEEVEGQTLEMNVHEIEIVTPAETLVQTSDELTVKLNVAPAQEVNVAITAAEPTAARPGELVPITLALANEVECSSLQFDIHPSEGLSIVLDEDDEVAYDKLDRNNANVVTAIHLDGTVRLTLSNILTNIAVNGNEGDFITLYAKIDEGYKGESVSLTIDQIVMSDTGDGGARPTKSYDGKGCTIEFENLAIADNEEAWQRIQTDLSDLAIAVEACDAAIQTLEYGKRLEEFSSVPADVQAWIEETLAANQALYETIDLGPDSNVDIDAKVDELDAALNSAAKYDASRYCLAAETYYFGGEDIEGVKAAIESRFDELQPENQAAVTAAMTEIENAIADMNAANAAYTEYDPEVHAAIIAEAQAVMAQVQTLVENIERLAAVAEDLTDLATNKEILEEWIADNLPVVNDPKYNAAYNAAAAELSGAVGALKTTVAQAQADGIVTEAEKLAIDASIAQVQELMQKLEDTAVAANDARVADNKEAASADYELAVVLNEEFTEEIYNSYDSEVRESVEDYFVLGNKIALLSNLVDAALTAVEKEGSYESPFDAAEIRAEINALKAQLDMATAISGVKGQNANGSIYTVDGKRVDSPVKGQVNIVREGGKSVKLIVK